MKSLYEIDANIIELLETGFNSACIDEETGEVDEEKANAYLENLQIDRKDKIENIAVFIKSLEADALAIKAEEKRLKERREAKERKAERMKSYVANSMLLHGDLKLETPRVALSFRKSDSVVVDDIALLTDEYITTKTEVVPNKTALKQALKYGEIINGAHLEEKQNLQIK